jgi:DNA polymerase I
MVIDALRAAGVERGAPVALALASGVGLGLATSRPNAPLAFEADDPCAIVQVIEDELRPRWLLWSVDTAHVLVAGGVRLATCWDIAAVHRLLFGGWQADPAVVWARLHDLTLDSIPREAPIDLFNQCDEDGADDDPVQADGHLRATWVNGGWSASTERLGQWAALAATVVEQQQDRLRTLPAHSRAATTARSESTAELLCAELAADGLPMDRATAEAIVAQYVGPRPRTDAEEADQRRRRDDEVLRHVPNADDIDLRSPGQVKSLLRRAGIEVPDTRAWRLRAMRDEHPVVDALLAWRKAERVATTYGYAWLDEHVSPDGRLRGGWSGTDGAAGRMTASAGLHNMPADMREAVIAEPGHVFVRADLGQIEPRVLASVSGDRALAAATVEDDMYAPVALQLGVDRPTAKVAVLGAMYGQTTGNGAQVLGRLESTYPVAMAYLRAADRAGQGSRSLRTYGGRLIDFGSTNANEVSERDARRIAAARGRYGRNAMVQGAAAELFKVWAVTTRARGGSIGARIVLCLHDELLVHVPAEHGADTAKLVEDCLQEAVRRWAPDDSVRFVADVTVIDRWSTAKQ